MSRRMALCLLSSHLFEECLTSPLHLLGRHILFVCGNRPLVPEGVRDRAGAIAQLQIWADRLAIPCVAGAAGLADGMLAKID